MDPNQITNLKKIFDIVNTSSNPQSMLDAMAVTNPSLKQIMDELSTSKMSSKDIFYKKAKEKGMSDEDIEKFLSQIKGIM